MKEKKKLFSQDNEQLEELYLQMRKKRKSLIVRTIIMIMFLFGVNAFAWFAYITKADFNFESSVVSWDVDFFEDSVEVEDVVVMLDEMYPGMDPYNKTITVTNTGEMNGNFSYEIKTATLFGVELVTEATPSSTVMTSLKSDYPFSVSMASTKTMLKPQETLQFTLDLNWEYELPTKTYYKVLDIYKYDPSVVYYVRKSGTYVDSLVTSEKFDTLKNTLFVEKDDADSFFGEMCKSYEQDNPGQQCFSMVIQLKVEQVLG